MIIYIIGVLMTVIFMSLAHHFYLSSITYNVSTKNKIFTKIKNHVISWRSGDFLGQ